MTYIDKCLKEKRSITQIQDDLKAMIESHVWTSHFCHNSKDFMCSYSDSLNSLKHMIRLSKCQFVSSVYSEDLALDLVKDALQENIPYIAQWILSNDSSMQLMGFCDNVGYVVYQDKSVDENASYVLVSLRKNEKPCRNSSGFYVEFIYPISEINHP